jgi:hypothetical protein
MRSIQSKTLAAFGTIIASAVSLTMPLVSPSLAAPQNFSSYQKATNSVAPTFETLSTDSSILVAGKPGRSSNQQHNSNQQPSSSKPKPRWTVNVKKARIKHGLTPTEMKKYQDFLNGINQGKSPKEAAEALGDSDWKSLGNNQFQFRLSKKNRVTYSVE